MRRKIYILIIILITIAIYINSLSNDFTNWDDGMIYKNPTIRELSLKNIKKIFTPSLNHTYQPLRVLSYAIDYHFWGLNPLGYRITNLIFYLLTILLIIKITETLLDEWNIKGATNTRVVFFSSLLFAVHPVHVEVVVWLSARKEVLLSFFFFLSFYFYIKGRMSKVSKVSFFYFLISFLSFVAAFLSKPTAVVFPGVIILYEIIRQTMISKEKVSFPLGVLIPFIIISLGGSILLIIIMQNAKGIKPLWGGNIWSNFALVSRTYAIYFKHLFLNSKYAATYPNPYHFKIDFITYLSFFIHLAIFLIIIWSFKHRKPIILFGFGWYYITMLPTSNIIPISHVIADRYIYLGSYGLILILAFTIEKIYTLNIRNLRPSMAKVGAIIIFSSLCLFYSFITIIQNKVWQNSLTLWMDNVEKYPKSDTALVNLAVVYSKIGEYKKAKELLEKELKILPFDYEAHNNLGVVYQNLKEYPKAAREFVIALKIKPGYPLAWKNLGGLYFELKKYKNAANLFENYLKRYPADSEIHYRLGLVYRKMGQYEKAIKEFKTSIKLTPYITTPYKTLGELYLKDLNDKGKALYYLKKAIKISTKAKEKKEIEKKILIIKSSLKN